MNDHTTNETPNEIELPQGAIDRFWSRIDTESGECWLWTGNLTTSGYGQLSVNGKLRQVHRLSWEIHFGSIPERLQICHHCDTPACVRPDHLFLGTHQDNMRDRDDKNRQARFAGSTNPSAKLEPQKVEQIREMASNRTPYATIAESFQISQSLVEKIVARKLWNNVAPEQERVRQHPAAKITESDALEIRRLHNEGLLHREIAERFGISRSNVSSIVSFKLWANVNPNQVCEPRNHSAKVTESEVIEIRRLAESGLTQQVIAEQFGITRSAVGLIVNRKNWKHVP